MITETCPRGTSECDSAKPLGGTVSTWNSRVSLASGGPGFMEVGLAERSADDSVDK
jgi:hypothetical protein